MNSEWGKIFRQIVYKQDLGA